jgi:hypothetical protein
MNIFGNWTAHDVEQFNAKVEAAKQSQGGARAGESWIDACTGDSATPDRAIPPLESKLHEYILDFWRNKGWLAIHSRTDKRTTQAKGVADCILICPKTVVFVEVKRKPNKPTKEQLAFLAHVKKMGWPNAVVYSKEEFHQFIDPLI